MVCLTWLSPTIYKQHNLIHIGGGIKTSFNSDINYIGMWYRVEHTAMGYIVEHTHVV